MVARGDQAATPASATGSVRRVRGKAQQARREVIGEGRLADPRRPDDQDGVGGRALDHGRGGGQRCGPGPGDPARVAPVTAAGRARSAGYSATFLAAPAGRRDRLLRRPRPSGRRWLPLVRPGRGPASGAARRRPCRSASAGRALLAGLVLRPPATSSAGAAEGRQRVGARRLGAAAPVLGAASVTVAVPPSAPEPAWPAAAGGLAGCERAKVLGRALAGSDRAGGRAEDRLLRLALGGPAGFGCDLRPEHRLELRRHLGPRLVAAPRPLLARRNGRSIVVAGTLFGPASRDVRVAIDPAASAAPAVPLAIDGSRVATAPAAPIGDSAAGPATVPADRPVAPPLFGDQVLGDRRLVLVVDVDRREIGRRRAVHPDLAVPERAEGRRARWTGGDGDVDLVLLLVQVEWPGHDLARRDGGSCHRLAFDPAPAATATATAAPTAALTLVGSALSVTGPAGQDLLFLHIKLELGLGLDRSRDRSRDTGRGGDGRLGQLLAGQGDQATAEGGRRAAGSAGRDLDRRSLGRSTAGAGSRAGRGGHRLGLADPRPAPATTRAAATADAGAFGLLVGDLGHRQVLVVVGDPPAGARRALLDLGDLGDVGEQVGDLDQVRAGVAPEADHLAADAHLLDRPDRRREVAVARHDDRHVEVAGRLHQVDHELDVEVGLDLAVAVLADVLADDLVVVAARKEWKLRWFSLSGSSPV